jgi:hypothetical protein
VPPEIGIFEGFYASPIQHPVALWLAAGVALGICITRRGLSPSMRQYCVALGVLSLADAWLTTSDIPLLGPLPDALSGIVPLFFVLAGDLRVLLVVMAGTSDGRLVLTGRSLLYACALTLVVPVFTQVALALLPASMGGARVMFLIYEIAFAVLALALLRWHPSASRAGWIRRVTGFAVLYYGLWASADAWILATGSDLGYLLRLLPNLLYYGGLIAVMGIAASTDSRRNSTEVGDR